MEVHREITVVGACEHNLKSINARFRRGAITVVTGVSGSGKSSLVFDTIHAEAQRRFLYTLSNYSRQFLDLSSRPKVQSIKGLSPAIALAQTETRPSRRSTVGSLTDLAELMAIMFARFGTAYCPTHNLPTTTLGLNDVALGILKKFSGKTLAICAPIVDQKKGNFTQQLNRFAERGFARAYVDGEIVPLSPVPRLVKEEKHTIKLIVDPVKIREANLERLLRSMRVALDETEGYGEYFLLDGTTSLDLANGGRFSTAGGCPTCGYSWPRFDSRYFNANSLGRCGFCNGFGTISGLDLEDEDAAAQEDMGNLETCRACGGVGIAEKYKAIHLFDTPVHELHRSTIGALQTFLSSEPATDLARDNPAFRRVHGEALSQTTRLVEAGLTYLTPSRRILTLSTGELQRLKLAGILSDSLRGIIYVLDEPSQGLHPNDLERVVLILRRITETGNTVLIVDHDESLLKKADWIIDLGPGGGQQGGQIIAEFAPDDAAQHVAHSRTALSLVGEHRATLPQGTGRNLGANSPKTVPGIEIRDVAFRNLSIRSAFIPLAAISVVTGVSGAGKSSLVNSILFNNLFDAIEAGNSGKAHQWLHCRDIRGAEQVTEVDLIDRRPVAKSSVSMPATYLDVFGDLRTLYARLPEAQVAGLSASAFSLFGEGGRCLECSGRGEVVLKMRFLPDERMGCPVCAGGRYRPHVNDVRYRGKSLSDVLAGTINDAYAVFGAHRRIADRLRPAVDLGLGYLKMGQPSSSLSGGEAQRLKIAPYLSRKFGKGAVLFLDEPTTGLHAADITLLLACLRSLVDRGTTVVVIEHNLDLVSVADWVLDLGPGAAENGGRLVAQGSPAEIAKAPLSVTGTYLKSHLITA